MHGARAQAVPPSLRCPPTASPVPGQEDAGALCRAHLGFFLWVLSALPPELPVPTSPCLSWALRLLLPTPCPAPPPRRAEVGASAWVLQVPGSHKSQLRMIYAKEAGDFSLRQDRPALAPSSLLLKRRVLCVFREYLFNLFSVENADLRVAQLRSAGPMPGRLEQLRLITPGENRTPSSSLVKP